jgi:DNA end-binding protein Ku
MLISSLEAEFEPQKYHDNYRANLQQMIEAKVAGQNVVATPETHVAPVIDIMEALKKSLAEKRKPASVATAVAGGGTAEEPVEVAAPKKRARKMS